MKIKSSPRLKDFDYKGSNAYFITICTYQRKNHFVNSQIVNFVLEYLIEKAHSYLYQIFAYCFMPDHLHILIQGSENSLLKDFMKDFKQVTEFHFRKKFASRLWHLSYYEHVLRKEESLRNVALYIFNNPVRKNFVREFLEYPFLGSLMFDIKQM